MDAIRITELPSKTYVEQGDYMAIDNQNNGTKKVQFTNLLDDTLSQENKIAPADVVGATLRAVVGSPLTASTVAQMTDTNRIYVYVGSESGYTNGNWYYWNGSAWISGGVYNSVAVVTDPTLTLSGVPADAKATGDAIDVASVTDPTLTLSGVSADAKATGDTIAVRSMINGNISSTNYQSYFTDANNAPRRTAYIIEGGITSAMIANLPRYGSNGMLITISARPDNINVLLQLYITRNTVYRRTSDYLQVWKPWTTNSIGSGYITTTNYTDYFTNANNAPLNSVYEIQATMDESMISNLPAYHMTTQAVLTTLCGLNQTEGSANAIQFFAIGSGGDIYYRSSDYARTNWSKWEKIIRQAKIYRVGADKEYTSVTACLRAIPFGTDEEKIVYIDGGVYDIFQEYVDGNVPVPPTPTEDPSFNPSTNYVNYNIWVQKNTHIIGLGNVIFKFMPTPAQLNYNENWSKTTSPLNVREGCTIENIEIWAKNCRYCIHDDYNYVAATDDAIKKYINVTCRRFLRTEGTNYGWREVIGIGAGKRQRIEFHNCKFISEYSDATNFYIHNRDATFIDSVNTAPLTEYECSRYILANCVIYQPGSFVGVLKLANEATTNTQHIYFDMLSTFVSGGLLSCDLANNSTGNNANVFDITQVMCNTITNTIRDANNQYPVKVY